jgi:hypothetical protein
MSRILGTSCSCPGEINGVFRQFPFPAQLGHEVDFRIGN